MPPISRMILRAFLLEWVMRRSSGQMASCHHDNGRGSCPGLCLGTRFAGDTADLLLLLRLCSEREARDPAQDRTRQAPALNQMSSRRCKFRALHACALGKGAGGSDSMYAASAEARTRTVLCP